jgi:hypothetical protein
MAKIGNAAITWTSTDDANPQRVHELEAPLRVLRPGGSLASWSRENLDRTQVEHWSVSSGVYELAGTARYEIDGRGLVDLIQAGSKGKTLRYIPNLSDPDTNIPIKLLSPLGDAGVALDRDRGVRGEYTVDLRFRTTDGSMWEQTGLMRGTNTLFWFRAGGSMSNIGGGGYGTLSTALDEKARTAWVSTDSSAGPRNVPTLLLEDGRTNYCPYSEGFATAWSGTATHTTGQPDPLGGNQAMLVADTSTSANQVMRSTTWNFGSTALVAYSMFVKAGSTASTGGDRIGYETSTGTNVVAIDISWSSGVPSVTYTLGSSVAVPERWRGGWWRIQAASPAGASTSTLYRAVVIPAALTANNTGEFYVFGVQAEQ